MKRDQESHPHPEMFGEWAKGGPCPYSIPVERYHFFQERASCWNRRFKRMSTAALMRGIAKEKGWTFMAETD
jgi:hypothetical protein